MHFENKHWKLQISIWTCLIIDRLCPWCWGIDKELIVENNIHMLSGWQAQGDWECCTDTVANIPVCSAEQKIFTVYNFPFLLSDVHKSKKYSNNFTTYVLVIFNKAVFIDLKCDCFTVFNIFTKTSISEIRWWDTHLGFWPLTSVVHSYYFSAYWLQSMIMNMQIQMNTSKKQIPYYPWKCSVVCLTRVSWRLSWRGRNSESLRFERKKRGKKRRRKRRT